MRRLIVAVAFVFSPLAIAANAESPKFRVGQDYSQVQDALLALGWKGARPSGEKCQGHLCNIDKGEVISCAGIVEAPCLTRWTKANVAINILTVRDPAVFKELQCLTQCEQDVATAPPLSSSQSYKDNLDPLEAVLVRAMQLNVERTGRLAETGEAIRAYIRAGYVRLKPDSGADFTDYRIVRRPAKLFGQDLLVIEEEYRRNLQIGCCVSPGIGVILRVTSDLTALTKFTSSNGCSIDKGGDAMGILQELKLKSVKGEYLGVSCRERDHAQ